MRIFKDGRPNGFGTMFYKNSIPSTAPGMEYEMAIYKGNFRQGKREGKGKMVWSDGSVFDGMFKDDERYFGTMVMDHNIVYKGHFENDKFHGPNE